MRGTRYLGAVLVAATALLAGVLPATAASAAVGASSVSISTSYVLAAGGSTFDLSGTATDGAGAAVQVEQSLYGVRTPLGSAVVQPDGTWTASLVMPVGDDGLVRVYATAPGLAPGSTEEDTVLLVRHAGGSQAQVTAPASATITGTGVVLTVDAVFHDPSTEPQSLEAFVLQGHRSASRSNAAVWTGLGTSETSVHTEVDLSTLVNGPAVLVVQAYSGSVVVGVAVKEIVVDLDGGLATVTVSTRQFSDGRPYLDMLAAVQALGADAAVSWSLDDGPVVEAHVLDLTKRWRFTSGAPMFDSAPAGSTAPVGAQLIAEGPHVAHVTVTNRGVTTVQDIPFVVDTSPRLTIESAELVPSWNDVLGQLYTVHVKGHSAGVWMQGGTVELVGPDGVQLVSSVPPFAGGGALPDDSTWGFNVKVAGWDTGTPLRVRVRVRDLDGSPRCVQLALRGGLPLQATCEATLPGATQAVPSTWTPAGLPFTVTWADDGGSPVSIVRTTVAAVPGVSAPPQIGTAFDLVGTASAGRAPVPAPGTAYRLSFGVENSLGAGADTVWGVVQASGVSASSRTVRDGSTLTVGGTVVATVPGLSLPAMLPTSSAAVVCTKRSTGAIVLDTTLTPAASTRAFGSTYRPRSTLACRASFRGAPLDGVAPSSRAFTVSVRPVLTASLADSSIPRGTTTTLVATVSSAGRSDWVRLQRWSNGAWRELQKVRPGAGGHARFDVRATIVGTTSYRVVQQATLDHASSTGPTVRLRGY